MGVLERQNRVSVLHGTLAKRLLLVGTWIAVAGGLTLWLSGSSTAELRDQLRRWQFWSLEAQFLLLLCLSLIAVPRVVASLKLKAHQHVFPVALSLLTFLLVTRAAPETNRIYYDEHIYQAIGQNFTDLRLAQMCNDGNVEYGSLQCWRGEYNKEPYGYPYLLSVAYRLVGVHESVAFIVNAVAAALTVWVVFLLTARLTGQPHAGEYAAVVAALIPEHLRWSHTAAVEPTAALACAFAVLTAVAFIRERTLTMLLWMVAATAFASQFRPESSLVVFVALIIVCLHAPAEFGRPRMWWAGVLGLALSSLHLAHLLAVRHEGWGTTGPRLSPIFVVPNLETNGWFLLGDRRFPVLYTALALAGLVLYRHRRASLTALLYFLPFWGIFLFFYAGSYNYGADDRFSLMMSVPVAVMAGIGTWTLVETLSRQKWGLGVPWRLIAIVVLVIQFGWYVAFVRSVGEEAWGARADVTFARSIAQDLPANSMILTHNPNMFHLWGRNAAQASLATTDPGYLSDVLATRYAGGVYFHWNFWCNVADPVQRAFCSGILERFSHTLVREYRERDYRYAVYRLTVAPSQRSSER